MTTARKLAKNNSEGLGEATPTRTAAAALQSLRVAYRRWRDFLSVGFRQSGPANDDEARRVVKCFDSFGKDQPPISDRARRLILAIDRSKALLESALAWEDACIGVRGNKTDADRGAQWRLVMAWCGLEELIDTIMRGRTCDHITTFVRGCTLPAPEPFPPPKITAELTKWRTHPDLDMLEFLDPRGQGRRIIESWLVKGNPICHRTDVLLLAQALRHATAHGALSPAKVRGWGMCGAADRLVVEIGDVAAAAMEQLTATLTDARGLGKNRSADGRIRALNVRQPYAEAIMRGQRPFHCYGTATPTRGRIYIYASHSRPTPEEEADVLGARGMEDVDCDALPHRMILGTVELYDCVAEASGKYRWCLRAPERFKRVRAPKNRPQATWFTPF
jgi:hypothetical protein